MRGLASAAAALLGLSACSSEPAAPEVLVPGLAKALPALSEVRLQQGDASLVFERQGEEWRIRDAEWRADRRWLQPLLLGLANARCDEARTADPARFGRIGVAWPSVSEASPDGAFARPTGRLSLTVEGREVSAVIGYPQARGGTYVRVEGAPHSCLSAATLRLPARVSEWFDPQLWRIPTERVIAVVVEDPGAAALRLVPGEGGFRPEGAIIALTPDADALASALAAPRQLDLRAAGSAEPTRVLRLEGEGDLAYALAVWREGGATWARVIAAPDEASAWYAGREFRLPADVAEPLWAARGTLGAP
ncbi:hypothetical protein [Silanimonas sp.]|jgi:hypothetical protein|uniref:hypothetical protein n=1 Tax=Silanimonas sp. TaxID=1929290 RepID=UPI0037CC3416